MTSEVRKALMAAVEYEVTVTDGHLERTHYGPFSSHAEVIEFINPVAKAAQVLEGPGASPLERLAHNVRTEELPKVRSRNFAMMLLHFEDEDITQELLTELVKTHKLPPQTTSPQSAEDEQRLLEALNHEDERVIAALVRLRQSGSFQALSPLREYMTKYPKTDYRTRLAELGLQAIQERIGPIESGGLTIAEGTSGALSEAEGQEGGLAIVEKAKFQPEQKT